MAGWAAIGPPVENDQSLVRSWAVVVDTLVSALAPSRELSCKDVVQSSCVTACAAGGLTSRPASDSSKAEQRIVPRLIVQRFTALMGSPGRSYELPSADDVRFRDDIRSCRRLISRLAVSGFSSPCSVRCQ